MCLNPPSHNYNPPHTPSSVNWSQIKPKRFNILIFKLFFYYWLKLSELLYKIFNLLWGPLQLYFKLSFKALSLGKIDIICVSTSFKHLWVMRFGMNVFKGSIDTNIDGGHLGRYQHPSYGQCCHLDLCLSRISVNFENLSFFFVSKIPPSTFVFY